MKSNYHAFKKRSILTVFLLIVLKLAIIGGLVYVAVIAVQEVQDRGLKHILEEVWEGNEK